MRHPEFPVVSFLLIPLLLCSLPSHIRTGSVCIIALIAWLTALNIIHGVNSLVWAGNVVIRLKVWCDITTKIIIGSTYAIPLCALCICRQLENISSSRQAIITHADKRRRMIFEGVMGLGIPLIFMALHYIVQGHRFDLIEDFGCYPASYVSVAGLLIVWIPPLVISLISMVYAVAAFHHFLQRRIEFATVLQSSGSAISPARYFRLMAFTIFEILWDSSTNIYVIYFNIKFTGLRPWISWDNVHSNFSRVGTFPHFLMPPWSLEQCIWQWWIIPISCIFFFLFFGLGEEALSDYRAALRWLQRTILRRNIRPKSSAILPEHSFMSPPNLSLAIFTQESKIILKDTFPPKLRDTAECSSISQTDSMISFPGPSRPHSADGIKRSMEERQSQNSIVTENFVPELPKQPNKQPTILPTTSVVTVKSHDSGTSLDWSSPEHPLFPIFDPTLMAPPAPRDTRSTASYPSSHRSSTSTDLRITISPASPLDADTSLHYREAITPPHCDSENAIRQ